MNIEDIKAGETYYIRVKPVDVCNEEGYINVRDMEWDIACFKAKDVYPVAAPKYDPNREFRKGDKVSVRKIHGKLPQCRYNGMVKVKEGDCCTIHEKEHRNCYWVTIPSGGNWCFDAAYLELLTPVEAMEPYYIEESTGLITLLNKHDPIFHKSWRYSVVSAGIIALTEAEAERDRLNAEWRKEMEK
jgi:hypothetical protein